MHRLTTARELEAIVGVAIAPVRMKQLDALDEGCRRILAVSSLAGFGFRDDHGSPHTTLVGGRAGFVEVESPKRIALDADLAPSRRDGVSFVFLLPGIGETLRLNGVVEEQRGGRLFVRVDEAFIHCPKCILRSGLWKPSRARPTPAAASGEGPLRDPAIAGFLAASPFVILSSWDTNGASDTSPRGDPAGFIRVLDGNTLAIPDRKGNQRTDTFHNLMVCDQLSLLAIVPGRDELVCLRGTASVTDDPDLLATMAIKGKAPHLALVVQVAQVTLGPSEALRAANVWQPASHIPRAAAPDLIQIASQHLARNQERGPGALLIRLLGRLLGAFPAPVRRLLDLGFDKDLASEGYDVGPPGIAPRKVRVVEVRRETADAVTLRLEDEAGAPFHFRPGQYFTLGVEIGGETVRRAYSASSAPGETSLALTIKRVAGGRCSTHVNETLRAGDVLSVIGPSGSFAVDPEPAARRQLVLIAGGSGITPMASIARTVLAREPLSRVVLLYGNRSAADIIFADALDRLRVEHSDRLVVRHVVQRPPESWSGGVGLLDEVTMRAELERLSPSPDAHFYVCGPEPMLLAARRALESLAVEPKRIHEERFSAAKTGAGSRRLPRRRLPMLIEQAGARLATTDVAPGKTLLEAGLAAGVAMPFSCTIGNCGECRVRLVSGEVVMDEPNTLSAEERAQGHVLACIARPLSATTIAIEEESDP